MILKLIILIFWLPLITKTILFHSYFWQLKEYRLDRILPHLKLKTGQQMLFSPFSLAKWSLILLFAFLPAKNLLAILALSVFLFELIFLTKRALVKQIYRPKITLRAGEIILGSFLLVLLGTIWLWLNNFPWEIFVLGLLCLERGVVGIVPSQVYLTEIPASISKEIKFRKAKERLKTVKDLKIIGVTGSFGKTSTKDFIAQILGQKYNVVKTLGTNNTKIGISQNILSQIVPDIQIFVAEMGAYKKGEIADICQLVKSDIAVVTGINEQHLAIFGSLKNLIEAKYEIVEALPKNGIAIFNGENKYCLEMAKKASKKWQTVLYQRGKSKSQVKFADLVWADSIVEKEKEISFTACWDKKKLELKTNILGQHNVANILAGVAIASQLGLKDLEIIKGVSQLLPSSQVLRTTKGLENITFLDDSFSSNQNGFLAAIGYLKKFKTKNKIVITPGIIELGSAGGQIHKEIGQAMKNVVDLVILTNENFLKEIKEGMREKKTKVIVENQPGEIVKIVKEKSPNVIVLLEGRLPANVVQALKIKIK